MIHIVQFLKANDSCELVTLRKIENFSLGDAPCSLPFWFNMSERQKSDYRRYAAQLFDSAVKKAESGEIDVLILDEVLDAVNIEALPKKVCLIFSIASRKSLRLFSQDTRFPVRLRTGPIIYLISRRKSTLSSTDSPRARG